MLAAALLWIAIQANVAAPDLAVCRGWSIAPVGAVSLQPLFTYPDYETGLKASGGVRVRHRLHKRLAIAVTARAGATRVADWKPLFDAEARLEGLPAGIEVRAGARHDDRLSREGPLSDFRDPTGRVFVEASVWPLRRGAFQAGAVVEYERALPGVGRLPSGVSGAAAARVAWPVR